MRESPSSREYSVWVCRFVNMGDRTGSGPHPASPRPVLTRIAAPGLALTPLSL
jgi:hypothetical protein